MAQKLLLPRLGSAEIAEIILELGQRRSALTVLFQLVIAVGVESGQIQARLLRVAVIAVVAARRRWTRRLNCH